ncbi:MAG TPA: hypothetical protein DCQ06_06560 [Myxococcales bacterium]|nr:hypothetical protein [Myxococcales bacterium]
MSGAVTLVSGLGTLVSTAAPESLPVKMPSASWIPPVSETTSAPPLEPWSSLAWPHPVANRAMRPKEHRICLHMWHSNRREQGGDSRAQTLRESLQAAQDQNDSGSSQMGSAGTFRSSVVIFSIVCASR